MNYYCTLFDSTYLTRGLSMYRSLVNVGEDFHLYIYAFDKLTRDIFKELNLPRVTVISLEEFETPELLEVKPTRTKGEYCWTCTAATILHALDTFNLPEVTYVDSDLLFFDKPSIILKEFRDSDKDVMITRHNYTPEYDQTATSGVYCVQFMTFKDNPNSRHVLNWWKDRCIEWCYAKLEENKFGDQKYLDDWTERFQGIHVMQNKEAGLAPWNIQQYHVEEGPIVNGKQAIFYHYHGFKWIRDHEKQWFLLAPGLYRLNENVRNYIYAPYATALTNSLEIIRRNYDDTFIKGIVWANYRLW